MKCVVPLPAGVRQTWSTWPFFIPSLNARLIFSLFPSLLWSGRQLRVVFFIRVFFGGQYCVVSVHALPYREVLYFPAVFVQGSESARARWSFRPDLGASEPLSQSCFLFVPGNLRRFPRFSFIVLRGFELRYFFRFLSSDFSSVFSSPDVPHRTFPFGSCLGFFFFFLCFFFSTCVSYPDF